ncbi:MAG: T9SS type A sorting domain-containing protein [Bacteroidota bacterium]
MKRLCLQLFFLSFLLLSFHTSKAQCDSFTLSQQSEVDSFLINNPNCTTINGDLTIDGGNSSITNLKGIGNVVTIEGDFLIEDTELTNLEDMKNLQTVNGILKIYNNDIMEALIGLEGLCDLSNGAEIIGNDRLKNLSGMDSIKLMGGLLIFENDSLQTLKGLEKVDSIKSIPNTPITGTIEIGKNPQLEHLDALSNVEYMDGKLSVFLNDNLYSIRGLRNIGYENMKELVLNDNMALDACSYANLCAFVAADLGLFLIVRNGLNCLDFYTFSDNCPSTVSTEEVASLEFNVFPNPSSSEMITVQLPQPIVQGQVELYDQQGRQVAHYFFRNQQQLHILSPESNGIFWLKIKDDDNHSYGLEKIVFF